ncbi:hypothetical protein SAMN05428975_4681 [Mucilaginibacter sp. OK268]|uniref:hypothetical protein n=1 Tax=Mucilaginibacter sp. OK268 TaxID=1881048 RepID=UPI00088C4461|nr:hypothetical protein [Mucilaginibacter sp. OK268]SDP98266.1 hypothetical protein SAMN05428975_4681 [Mucilaginibacter sp. OK268]
MSGEIKALIGGLHNLQLKNYGLPIAEPRERVKRTHNGKVEKSARLFLKRFPGIDATGL